MTDADPIARPYAKAVFELAADADDGDDTGTVTAWQAQLDLLAAVAADARVAAVAADPRVGADAVAALLLSVADGHLTDGGVNLVRLLARNRRVRHLPAIARAFTALRLDAERVVTATMTTAVKMNDGQRKKFTAALTDKLGRAVKLTFATDAALLGGAVVRAGDTVIDGSVRAQLTQLTGALRA